MPQIRFQLVLKKRIKLSTISMMTTWLKKTNNSWSLPRNQVLNTPSLIFLTQIVIPNNQHILLCTEKSVRETKISHLSILILRTNSNQSRSSKSFLRSNLMNSEKRANAKFKIWSLYIATFKLNINLYWIRSMIPSRLRSKRHSKR